MSDHRAKLAASRSDGSPSAARARKAGVATADSGLDEQLLLALRGVWRTAVRLAHSSVGEPHLPDAQIEVLHALAAHGPLSPTQLAERLQLARPTVSNLTRDMANRGLLARWRSTADGRAALLSLTPEAETLMATVHRRRVDAFSRALDQLPDRSRQQLASAMPALIELQRGLEGLLDSELGATPDR